MNDAHGDETSAHHGEEPTPYLRLHWPMVAIGLLGLVAVVLVIGVLANRYLRPQVGLVSTPPPSTAVAAGPLPTAPPTPAPAPIAPTPTTDSPTRLVVAL